MLLFWQKMCTLAKYWHLDILICVNKCVFIWLIKWLNDNLWLMRRKSLENYACPVSLARVKNPPRPEKRDFKTAERAPFATCFPIPKRGRRDRISLRRGTRDTGRFTILSVPGSVGRTKWREKGGSLWTLVTTKLDWKSNSQGIEWQFSPGHVRARETGGNRADATMREERNGEIEKRDGIDDIGRTRRRGDIPDVAQCCRDVIILRRR